MNVRIFAPYGHDDLTPVAIALADVADQHQYVRYHCLGRKESNVDADWDGRVLPAAITHIREGVTRCCVWFGYHPQLFRKAFRAGLTVRHVLLPLWSELTPKLLEDCREFDAIVCLSASLRRVLLDYVPQEKLQVTGPGMIPCYKGQSRQTPVRSHIVAYFNRYTKSKYGAEILTLLAELCRQLRQAQITVVSYGSWNRQQRTQLQRIQAACRGQFSVVESPGKRERRMLLYKANWFADLSVRSNSAYYAHEAISSRLPVFAWDLPPLNEIVLADTFGRLAHCQVSQGAFRCPEVVIDEQAMQNMLFTVITSISPRSEYRLKIDESRWERQLDVQRKHFLEYWGHIFSY